MNYSIVGNVVSSAPELSPREPTLMAKALFLPGPGVALLPGTTAPDPLSLRYQQGWMDGATQGANHGVLAGAALGALAAWLLLRK